MEDLRNFTQDIAVILDDIDETFKLIATADPVEEKELREHIKEQQRKLREMRRKQDGR